MSYRARGNLTGQVTADGIWISAHAGVRGPARPGLFLDRDGVIVKEVNYLSRKEDVVLENGACELLAWARAAGLPVAVVTNQAGIARQYYDWQAFETVQEEITRQLAAKNCAVDLTIACPFHPEYTPDYSDRHDYWRKPSQGMLVHAAEILGVDLSRSWLIGDNASDSGAAKAAGLPGALHVLTGHGAETREAARNYADETFQVIAVDDLWQARAFLQAVLVA